MMMTMMALEERVYGGRGKVTYLVLVLRHALHQVAYLQRQEVDLRRHVREDHDVLVVVG